MVLLDAFIARAGADKVLTGWRLETLEQCLDYYSGVESWHCKLRQHRQREFYKAEDTKLHAESNAATPALAVMIAMFEVLVNHPEMAAAFQVAA